MRCFFGTQEQHNTLPRGVIDTIKKYQSTLSCQNYKLNKNEKLIIDPTIRWGRLTINITVHQIKKIENCAAKETG